MKKIACVGYHATGAGVIDDLFRECDNVEQGRYECEVRFMHDPDGVADLEYHLVQNPHRSASGQAIKRFIRYSRMEGAQSKHVFGNIWFDLSLKYAESLALMKFKGWRFADLEFLPLWQRLFHKFRRGLNHFLPPSIRHPNWYDYLPKVDTYYSLLTKEDFDKKTRAFVEELLKYANPNNKEYLMLDQFVPSHNTWQVLQYVEDMKVIIVDRDPRDLYIHNMEHKDHRLPKDPYQFAIQYKLMRTRFGEDPDGRVLRINFEDMIYNYDEFTKRVFAFVGIDPMIHHVSPKSRFNPEKSIRGTKLWDRHPQYKEAVEIIMRELPDFLYNYPND